MKNTTYLIIGVAVIMGGIALYYWGTRPIAPPSEQPAPADNVPANNQSAEYDIVSEESSARFSVGETLRGKPFTAVGTTKTIAGRIMFGDVPGGTVRVNARTFATDSGSRDNAIARFILESEKPEYEFIEFEIGGVSAMPAMDAGASAQAQFSGNLKIRDIAKPVSFAGTLERRADGGLRFVGETMVKRTDYGLTIPNIPFVANVDEEVALKADIVMRQAF